MEKNGIRCRETKTMSWPWNPEYYPRPAYNLRRNPMQEEEKKEAESESTFASLLNDVLEFGRKHLGKKERKSEK